MLNQLTVGCELMVQANRWPPCPGSGIPPKPKLNTGWVYLLSGLGATYPKLDSSLTHASPKRNPGDGPFVVVFV